MSRGWARGAKEVLKPGLLLSWQRGHLSGAHDHSALALGATLLVAEGADFRKKIQGRLRGGGPLSCPSSVSGFVSSARPPIFPAFPQPRRVARSGLRGLRQVAAGAVQAGVGRLSFPWRRGPGDLGAFLHWPSPLHSPVVPSFLYQRRQTCR